GSRAAPPSSPGTRVVRDPSSPVTPARAAAGASPRPPQGTGGSAGFRLAVVVHFLELGVHHVVVGLAVTGPGPACRTARLGLLAVGLLRNLRARFREGVGLALDRILVVLVEHGLEVRDRRLDGVPVLAAHLVAQVL